MDLDQPTTEEFKETFSEVKPRLLHKALRFTSYFSGDFTLM